MASRAEIIAFADIARRELDTDQIKDLIRRTPGIGERNRVIAYNFLAEGMYDVDNSVSEGVGPYHRTTIGRHLRKVIPMVKNRYELDEQLKAGA